MTQPIINQQELIEVVPFEGFLLFGKIPVPGREQLISVIAGFSQEVFRENTYLGSVSSSSPQSVKAQRGDSIYCVSLAAQSAGFKGTVRTTDEYCRPYEVHFDLVVRDAKRCVEQYRNGADLIGVAVRMLRNGMEKILQQYKHDQIDSLKLNIESYSTILKNEYGLGFLNFKWEIQDDIRRISEREGQQKTEQRRREIDTDIAERKYELQRQADLRKAELLIEAGIKKLEAQIRREQESIQKQYDRDEKAWQNTSSRQEKMRSQLNEARIRLLNKTVDDLISINSERMQDAIDSNISPRRIIEDVLQLIGVFDHIANEDVGENIINSSLPTLSNSIMQQLGRDELETEEIEKERQ